MGGKIIVVITVLWLLWCGARAHLGCKKTLAKISPCLETNSSKNPSEICCSKLREAAKSPASCLCPLLLNPTAPLILPAHCDDDENGPAADWCKLKVAMDSTWGAIGYFTNFLLFLSPIPTFHEIYKMKSVQSYKPDPYVATALSCAMWVLYGLPAIRSHGIVAASINGVGFFIQIFYIAVFLVYSDPPKRFKIAIALVAEAVLTLVVVVVTCFLDGVERTSTVKTMCIISTVVMYMSPLSAMKQAYETRSAEFLPCYPAFACYCTSSIWLVYFLLASDDLSMAIANGIGALSGLVQIALAAFYAESFKRVSTTS